MRRYAAGEPVMTEPQRPSPAISYTEATWPFGSVTNELTDGWAVIDVERMEVVGERLYRTEEEALNAARQARRRVETEQRANRFFDEELTMMEDDR